MTTSPPAPRIDPPSLELRSVTKRFDGRPAVAGVSFALETGEVLAVLGPSGSGKSTLLMLIAGLETPDAGDILWQGQSITRLPTHQRGFGLMFQDYVLFPHKDVAGNVAFGLKMQGAARAEQARRVREVLELVGLPGFEARDVNTLSGGEQQRVALARALAPRPRLLMLDEPLGALDRALRERLLDDLHGILRSLKQTALYVTHDQAEAFALADRVIVMRAGRVVQIGPPAEVYARPASRFVAEFLGLTNILPGRLNWRNGGPVVETQAGEFSLGAEEAEKLREREPGPVEVVLRPDGAAVLLEAADGPRPGARNRLSGRVLETSFRGRRIVLRLEAAGAALSFEFPAAQPLPEAGSPLSLQLAPDAVHVLAEEEAA